jgi:hypothetical protein
MLVFSAADFEDFLEPRPELAAGMEGELEKVVRHLVAQRWPFRLHATYDESISRMLDVFEKVNREIPFDGLHWIFDHAETITPRNIERVRALGGGIAIQHRIAFQGEYVVDRYGAAAAKHTPPVARMLEMGVPVGAGTDATRVASYNPWTALYWLVSAGPEQSAGHPVSDGAKLRLKWRPYAPSKDSPWYFAVNGEVGSLSQRFNADGSSAELKLIGMYSRGPWVLGANLNLDRALKRNPLQAATYELDSKLSYQVLPEADGGLRLGLENYHFFGPMSAQTGPSQASNANYLVADFSLKGWDINLGLGKTTGATNDKLVLKAIIGLPFE